MVGGDIVRLDILTGLMLGDGYIGYPNKGSKKPRVEIERTISEYDYHEWTKEHLGLTWKAEQDRRKANGYHGIKIKSSCDEQLIDIHKVWYPEGKRIVPKDWIREHFNDVSMAVWFMDDGNTTFRESRSWSPNAKSYDLTISSQNFTIDEMEWFSEFLEDKYNLRWHVDGMGRLKFYKRESVERFFELIKPTVIQIPSMHRKIRL